MSLYLLRKGEVRGVVFRHYQKTARVFVYSVNYPGADNAVYSGEILHVPEKRVHERVIRASGGGMDDHAARFVDNKQVGVLIDDVDRYVLRDGVRRNRLRKLAVELVVRAEPVVFRGLFVVHRDEAVLDQLLRRRAGH